MPKKQYYKFLNLRNNKITSEHGKQTWDIGKEYSVRGRVVKCENGFHASSEPLDALNYVKGDVIALVEVSGDSDSDDTKVCYRSMKIVKAYKWTAMDSVNFAIYAAEQVVKIYEDKYPNDSRPRDAIKAAKAYLKNPTARAAADAAYAAARAAARAARAAAYAAAYAAARAARAAADAAYAAARAAYAAARAADAELKAKLNRRIKAQIKKLEEIK